MSFLTLWLVVLLFERSIASKHRSVNLALETVLQFDKADDFNVINKVQNFLSHIQFLLRKQQVNDNVISARRNNKYKFTDFVEDFITTIESFEDNNLKEVFRIVERDFRTRTIDNDLIDGNARRFLSRKLTEVRIQPAIKIRKYLDTILRELRADRNKKKTFIFDFINSLYKRDSERKLSKLIKRLNLFRKSARKSKIVLKGIINKVVNDVIYEHYNNLEDKEKIYIKKLLKSYLKNDRATTKLKIKLSAKVTEVTQESIKIEEKTDKSKPTKQVTVFEMTPETFKDISEETTKKLLTYITLYPKTFKQKKLQFRTGIPTVHVIENTPKSTDKDKTDEEQIKEANEIFTNQSVDINVNLILKPSQDLQDREKSQMVESFRAKSFPTEGYFENFERSLKRSFRKKKKYFKSSSHALSIETFGSLYKNKISNNNKKISEIATYNGKGKTTGKDRYYKSTSTTDDIVKNTSFREKMHVVGDNRRFNKLANLNEDKVTESNTKTVVTTPTTTTTTTETTQHTLTTSGLKPFIISTARIRTPVVTTDQSSIKTTKNNIINEIIHNKNVTALEKVTEYIPLFEKISTKLVFEPKDNTTKLVSKNNINNSTTINDVSEIDFDVKNYIKKSEILNYKDDNKKKQIEDKMKADFEVLLDSPTTNTTEGFTDVFKELEDAFQI